jgi:hypothetical protein
MVDPLPQFGYRPLAEARARARVHVGMRTHAHNWLVWLLAQSEQLLIGPGDE